MSWEVAIFRHLIILIVPGRVPFVNQIKSQRNSGMCIVRGGGEFSSGAGRELSENVKPGFDDE